VDDLDLARELRVEVVYADEHLVQLEAIVEVGHWRRRARAYTMTQDIAELADALVRFADGTIAEAEFAAGADNGIGLIGVRFYRIDRAGHIACHARLASGDVRTDHRPEQVSRLAIEFGAEAWGVGKFAAQLAEMARTQSGRASLAIEPHA
jgi:hypothetical protein